MADKQARFTAQEALQFHAQGKPGKLEIAPTKPLATQRDLSLAYSPGVAVPVEWPDPLRSADAGKPDAGAIPLSAPAWTVGVDGRVNLFDGKVE